MDSSVQSSNERARSRYLFPVIAIGVVLLFLAAPWPFAHKAHLALHGLCAQTPSHTYLMGGQSLPFDARMTGIYGGFIVSMAYFVARGRHRSAAMPSIPTIGVMASLVGVMAIDGFNSLFLDLRINHFYEPRNIFRLVSGIGTGITLAGVLTYLLAVSMWQRPRMTERVVTGRDLAILAPLQLPFIVLVLSGWHALYVPMTIFLVLAALTVVTAIAMVTIVLVREIDCSFRGFADAQHVAAYALVAAVIVMGVLSAGRTMLERVMGVPPLT